MKHPDGRVVTIPLYNNNLPKGLLRKIIQ